MPPHPDPDKMTHTDTPTVNPTITTEAVAKTDIDSKQVTVISSGESSSDSESEAGNEICNETGTGTGPATGNEAIGCDDSEDGNDEKDEYDDHIVEQEMPTSKHELRRQYIEARNLGRKQARKRRKAARKARDKAGILPNPPTTQQVLRDPVPSKNPSVPKKRKVRSKRYQKPTDPNTLSPHSRERWLARKSRRSAKKKEARQASKAGI